MIRLLEGQIHSRDDRSLILVTNGVGYLVSVPSNLEAPVSSVQTLFIHTHVREDALTLYGFRTKNELSFFELLLTINGIGPKMAMDIMNEPIEKIQNAIFTGNLPVLTRISGVGKKTAERMVLELKSKIDPTDLNGSLEAKTAREVHPDVIYALENLGYKRHHIQKVLSEIEEDAEGEYSKDPEAIIRIFLQKA